MENRKKVILENKLEIIGATLLTTEEAEVLPKAILEIGYSWWLRSPGYFSNHAATVYSDGTVLCNGGSVNFDDGAVRPVLIINLKSSNLQIGDEFQFGDWKFTIISDIRALCTKAVGCVAFREDWQAEDANDYETSDIKKFVNSWYQKQVDRLTASRATSVPNKPETDEEETNMKNFISIAIDGPAAAGKSTAARQLAKELGFVYVDTGAMYRAMAVCLIRNGTDPEDDEGIRKVCQENSVTLEYQDGEQRVLLNGEDVTGELRTEEVGKAASTSSKHPVLREKMTEMQRKLAETENVIMDGRDIGTVVLPDASLKIFMTADPDERAIRRFRELQEKGESVSLLELIQDMNARDLQDSTRKIAPLKPAEDAVIIDTTKMSVEQVITKIHSLMNRNVKQKWMKKWWLEYQISENLMFSGWVNTIHTCTKPEIPDVMQGTFSVFATKEGISGTFLPDNPDFCENHDFHVFGYVRDQYNYPVCCGQEFSARLEDCIVPDKSYSCSCLPV